MERTPTVAAVVVVVAAVVAAFAFEAASACAFVPVVALTFHCCFRPEPACQMVVA